MKPRSLVCLLIGLLLAGPALADDAGRVLSLGGAARQPIEGTRVTMWSADGLSAGLGAPPANLIAPPGTPGNPGRAMQLGGFLAWQGSGYQLDAMLAPSADGSFSAGLGASTGAAPGEIGTSYSVRVGADRMGDRFTVNPASGLGLTDAVRPTNDVNLTVTVNHALTPSLSIIGTAEARRNIGTTPDSLSGQSRFLFGAGLGYRF